MNHFVLFYVLMSLMPVRWMNHGLSLRQIQFSTALQACDQYVGRTMVQFMLSPFELVASTLGEPWFNWYSPFEHEASTLEEPWFYLFQVPTDLMPVR